MFSPLALAFLAGTPAQFPHYDVTCRLEPDARRMHIDADVKVATAARDVTFTLGAAMGEPKVALVTGSGESALTPKKLAIEGNAVKWTVTLPESQSGQIAELRFHYDSIKPQDFVFYLGSERLCEV